MPLNLDAITAASASAAPALLPQAQASGPQGPSAAGAFLDALAHHTGAFAHHAANGVEGGISSLIHYVAPGSPADQYASGVAANDKATAAQWEADYQQRMKGLSPVANAAANVGAVGGEVLPWMVPTNLPALGAKVSSTVAPLIRGLFADGVQGAVSAGVKRATEGAVIGAGSSEGDTRGTAIGAGGAVVLPPMLKAAGKGVSAGYQYVNALLHPEQSAANAVGALADRVNVSPDAVAAVVRKGIPDAPSPAVPQQAPGVPVPVAAGAAAPAVPTVADIAGMTPQQRIATVLKANSSPVPGVKYTADQALAPALGADNTPLVQLTQAFRNTAGGANAFSMRAAQNNAARLSYLQQFTKSPAEVEAMLADRRAFAKQYMGTVGPDGVYSPGSINNPVDASSILSHIDNLGQTNFATDPVIGRTLTSLKSQITAAADPETGTIRPDLLDGIRQNLRGIIADNANNGATSTKQEAGLQPVADTIVGAIEAANPGYRNYLAQYAQRSAPINTAEAANGLLSSVTGVLNKGASNAAGDTQLTLPAVTSAINSVSKLPHGVTPEFEAALNNVHQDLQNASVSNAQLGAPGSPTSYYGNLGGQVADAINGNLGLFSHPVTKAVVGVAGAGLGALTGGLDNAATHGVAGLMGLGGASKIGGARLQQGYIDMLMDPDKLAQALVNINPGNNPSQLGSYLSTLPIVGAP